MELASGVSNQLEIGLQAGGFPGRGARHQAFIASHADKAQEL